MKYKVDSEKVKNALDKFEWEELNNTGMRKINGGYAEADIFNYDEEYFDIETEYFRIEKRLDELSLLGYYAKGYEDDKTIKFTF